MLTEREEQLVTISRDIVSKAIQNELNFYEFDIVIKLAKKIVSIEKDKKAIDISAKKHMTLGDMKEHINQCHIQNNPNNIFIFSGHSYGIEDAIDYNELQR